MAVGQFFREINAGRSVDFLPQGIYPSKMIGNEFLKKIDLFGQIKSSCIVRFMDDFAIFDDDPKVVQQDFVRIQQLLGQFGLNVNPGKTYFDKDIGDVEATLSEIQKSLKEIVEEFSVIQTASSVELVEVENIVEKKLTDVQVSALLSLLKDEQVEEADADLILGFLHLHSNSMLEQIPALLQRFPNLVKHIYSICGSVSDKTELSNVIYDYLKTEDFFLEYQLFWLACIVEDHLWGHGCYGDILVRLYELTQDFKIARAKILEMPEQGYGFKEIRNEFLKTGQSDWLSWASAMGSRSLMPAERNYVLDYFSKGSPMNFLVASCAKKL